MSRLSDFQQEQRQRDGTKFVIILGDSLYYYIMSSNVCEEILNGEIDVLLEPHISSSFHKPFPYICKNT
jgi:hypothetical protein